MQSNNRHLEDNKTRGKHTKVVVIVSAAAVLLGAALAAGAAPTSALSKTDFQVGQRMADKSARGSCAVIAKIDGELTPAQTAQMAALDAKITQNLGFIHSVALTLPTRNLSKLAALPFISHLSYDGAVKKSDGFTDGSTGAAYARQNYGVSGKGVTVAVVDSGIARQAWDLQDPSTGSRVVSSPDFIGGTAGNYSDDRCGHGSHVAGIVGGSGSCSTGPLCTQTFRGIAPQTRLVSVRVLDANGASTVAATLAGLQWIVANKNTYNIRVANLSLGHPVGESYTTDPLCQAVEAAWKAGIVVVCAAGNNGRTNTVGTPGKDNEGWGTAYGSIQSPANDPYVITVGAMKNMDGCRNDDKIATYSSRGPSRLDTILKPDIVAPGNKIISIDIDYATLNAAYGTTNMVPYGVYTTITPNDIFGTLWANNRIAAGYSNAYFVLSGTSMAAPVVAGAAALMLQRDPTLTPDTIKARLMTAADKWEAPLGVYEAESPANTLTGRAYCGASLGASGGSTVHSIGGAGTLQFNGVVSPNTGPCTLTVAYLNGDAAARTALLSVNGGAPVVVSFPPKGTWGSGSVATVQVPVTLQAGANTLKFSNPPSWAPDIDRISLTQSDPLSFGAGYLNIPAALDSTVTVSQPALSPALKIDASGGVTIDTTVIGSKALSGVSTIWGSKAISGVATIYGSKAISGVSTVNSSKALSGSTVWADKTLSGSTTAKVDLSNVAARGE